MPFLDRYWWLKPLLAVAFLVVTSQPMKHVLLDDGFLSDFIRTPSDHIGDILFYVLTSLFFLAVAFTVATSAMPSRRRKLLRITAIGGTPEAIPRAIVEYQTVEYDLAKNPVVIQVQTTKEMKRLYLLVEGPFFLIYLAMAVIFDILFLFEAASHLRIGPITLGDVLRFLGLIALGVATILSLVLVSRYLPIILGRPYGVTFGTDGVMYRSELGKTTFLRWDEMQLFEASGISRFGHVSRPYTYRLYSARASATWRDPWPGNESLPTPTSTPGGPALAVKIIHDRTGLPPRTFVKALQVMESQAK